MCRASCLFMLHVWLKSCCTSCKHSASGQSTVWVLPGWSTRQTLPWGLFSCDLKRKYLDGATNGQCSITFIDAAVILNISYVFRALQSTICVCMGASLLLANYCSDCNQDILYCEELKPFFVFLMFCCLQTGPFNIGSPPLNTYNQQLWLMCVMQAEHSNSTTTRLANNNLLTVRLLGGDTCTLIVLTCVFLLSLSVGDFQQPFEINVELKGVVHDATEVQINKMHQKSRKLHCATVSLTKYLCLFSFHVWFWLQTIQGCLQFKKIEAILKQRGWQGQCWVLLLHSPISEMWWDHRATFRFSELHSVSGQGQLQRPGKYHVWPPC